MNQDELWEQVSAYCDGEMSGEERAAFERRMAEDDVLRQMAQSWRETMEAAKEWQHTPAPGEERVDSLPIPSLVRKPIRPLWRRLAAAALFVAGFGLGLLAQREMNVLDEAKRPVISGPELPEKAAMIPTKQTQIPEESNPQVQIIKEENTNRPKVTKASDPIVTQQEDGRIIIETTMQNSGARVVWIVDSGFRLPSENGVR